MWIRKKRFFLSLVFLAFLFCSARAFSQGSDSENDPRGVDWKQAYHELSLSSMMLLESIRPLLIDLREQPDFSQRWERNLQNMTSSLNSLGSMFQGRLTGLEGTFQQGLDTLTTQLSPIMNSITNISNEVNESRKELEEWKPLLQDLKTSLNDIRTQYRRDMIRAVLITGGVCIGVSVIVIVVIVILNYQNIKELLQ